MTRYLLFILSELDLVKQTNTRADFFLRLSGTERKEKRKKTEINAFKFTVGITFANWIRTENTAYRKTAVAQCERRFVTSFFSANANARAFRERDLRRIRG